MKYKIPTLTLTTPIHFPEEGFLLGNGDLSVSVYQAGDTIRLRLGKGDVWDRRADFSKDPKPAHIAEVAAGILEEGWTCGAYGGPVYAARGKGDPTRMREICQGTPPSYAENPFPCPKPVGELCIHVGGDRQGLTVTYRLLMEEGAVEVTCTWDDSTSLHIKVAVHPEENQIGVSWKFVESQPLTPYGGRFEGIPEPLRVWFSLRRNADAEIGTFAQAYFAESRNPHLIRCARSGAKPLPPPGIMEVSGSPVLVQTFPDDPDYADGFACAVAGGGRDLRALAASSDSACATIHLLPAADATSGEVCVAVATTKNDGTDAEPAAPLGTAEARAARALIDSADSDEIAGAAMGAAREFWSRSKIRLEDEFLESLWYSTLHAKRSILRTGKCPPGLFIPSTVRDYSLWHGDFHTNYNFQSVFLGDHVANHEELGDAYFDGMEFFLSIGRKIAREYYGCRGAFIQLSGYPSHLKHDPIGTVPMGRMAYMTGWVASWYFSRWLHFKDRQWLERKGYPVVRELALFYTDFLKLGDDGLFHAFPSNQGEDGFSDSAKLYTDRSQVVRHARYCMQAAKEMAAALDMDLPIQEEWSARLAKLAPEEGDLQRQHAILADGRYARLAPEFLGFDGSMPPRDSSKPPAFLSPGHEYHDWYPGKIPYEWMIQQRNGTWKADRDWIAMNALLKRWVHPNGLLWAMAISNYGRVGGWTESLGIIGAIQDLLIQSWGGVIELFPGWPTSLAASFENLRAEGAFLVSATKTGNLVGETTIHSEQGGMCILRNPWPGQNVFFVSDLLTKETTIRPTADGTLVLNLPQGSTCRLTRKNSPSDLSS